MSLILPETNNRFNLVNDNRLSLTAKTGSYTEFLTGGFYGGILIHCGNPLQRSDVHDAANTELYLFGNEFATGNGKTDLSFNTKASIRTFTFHSRGKYGKCPIGATNTEVVVTSPVVTPDNCEWVYVEKVDSGDGTIFNWRVNLISKNGTVTYGDWNTTTSYLCGIQSHDTTYGAFYLGGHIANDYTASSVPHNWREKIGHFLVINSSTDLSTTIESQLQQCILGGVHPDTVFGDAVQCYRTLNNTTDGLQPASIYDTDYTDFVFSDATNNRVEVYSNPVPVDTSSSVVLYEDKHNLFGSLITKDGIQSTNITVDGFCVGTVSSVEARLLNTDLTVYRDWEVIDASPTTNFSGEFTNVDIGIYYIELRPSDNPTAVYEGRAEWVVAPTIAIMGQSQMVIALQDHVPDKSTYPTVQHKGKSYYINKHRLSRFVEPEDYELALYVATEHWQRVMGDTPVIWMHFADAGEGHIDWLNDITGDDGLQIVGDGTFDSGRVSTNMLQLKNDNVNFVINWGTSDAGASDYEERVRGLMFDTVSPENSGTASDYTGASYKHLLDFMTIGGVSISGLTRHNADTIPSVYVRSNIFHNIRQNDLWQSTLTSEVPNKIVIGTQTNAIWLVDSAHPPAEGGSNYELGTPRIAESIGMTAAWLATEDYPVNPALRNAYISQDGATIRVPYMARNGGTITTIGGGTEVETFTVRSNTNNTDYFCYAVIDEVANEIVLTREDGGDFVTLFANESLEAVYQTPITPDTLTEADALAKLDKVLVETVSFMNRGLDVPVARLVVRSYESQAYHLDYEVIEQTPESVDKTNALCHYPLLSDSLDKVGTSTSVVTGSPVSNFEHGLQAVLENPISWDGNDLTELNVDANADGFTVTDEDGLVVKNV
jgi:hypothetical protein